MNRCQVGAAMVAPYALRTNLPFTVMRCTGMVPSEKPTQTADAS